MFHFAAAYLSTLRAAHRVDNQRVIVTGLSWQDLTSAYTWSVRHGSRVASSVNQRIKLDFDRLGSRPEYAGFCYFVHLYSSEMLICIYRNWILAYLTYDWSRTVLADSLSAVLWRAMLLLNTVLKRTNDSSCRPTNEYSSQIYTTKICYTT